jgi:osmotically-inducible protein OsmY
MQTNENLQKDVQEAIKWEPLLNAAEIGVTAKDGVITLTGTVDSYAKKSEAENAAKNVVGVKAVAEEIKIKLANSAQKTDEQIAAEIVNVLKWSWEVPADKIKIKVEAGWVTLEGDLHWNFQREAAMKAIGNLSGVNGITNLMCIRTDADVVEKFAIKRALARSWFVDDENIEVNVTGNKVTLTGLVGSTYQKREAERIAWNAPGVWEIDNELAIGCKI